MERRRALIVEDDRKIADLLRRGLALHDIESVVTTDGPAGLAAWMSQEFNVVVLDVMLPGIDGIELLSERRAAGDRTPVVLLTAHDDDAVRARAAAAGADGFLVKPFAYFELLARLDELTLGAAGAGGRPRSITTRER
jgi:DNA-binding response OmpR family regulator